MEVPLVDNGALMLRAAQRTNLLPNIALVTRFDETVPVEELEREATRLAASPFALGRRLRSPRVPVARPRWRMAPQPPPVRVDPGPLEPDDLSRWLDDQLSVRHDPEHQSGWALSGTYTSAGETVVALVLCHLFGTGRDLIMSCYGGLPDIDPSALGPDGSSLSSEVVDVASRLGKGVLGLGRLGAEIARTPRGIDRYGDLAELREAWRAWRDRDPSRGRSSTRRVAAFATVDAQKWDARAAEAGGTPTSLQVGLAANLARAARIARGGPVDRPVRMIVPVDLADRREVPDASATVGPIRLTSATVVLGGGRPDHQDLGAVRAATRSAFAEASRRVAQTGKVPVAPGVIDAMKLLPDVVSRKVVFGVHGRYDVAASNLGPLPDGLRALGDRTARDAAVIAFPLGSDQSIAVGRHGDAVQVGVIADPSRLGGGPSLRQRLAAELGAWGFPDAVW